MAIDVMLGLTRSQTTRNLCSIPSFGIRDPSTGDGLGNRRFARNNPEAATRMIRKLKSGGYRLYSRKLNPKTGKRRNLGTFPTREGAEKHERAVQFFKRAGK